jgi:hypothetical protein
MSRAEHAERMLAIYQRLEAIERKRADLWDEERSLKSEIIRALGVSVGDEIADRRFGKVRVAGGLDADFYLLDSEPGEPLRVSARVTFEAAPQTKDGFHARTRVGRSVMDGAITIQQEPKP